MQVATVTSKPLEVSMKVPKKVKGEVVKDKEVTERLKIVGAYPYSEQAQNLYTNLAVMELIAAYMPQEINADFPIPKEFRGLIQKMYLWEGEKSPRIRAPRKELDFSFPKTERGKVAVAYSAGKDSMWNMWWAREKYGGENVLGVHIQGLNKAVAKDELDHALKQKQELGFENFKVIELANSSKLTGHEVMRSRDMCLSAIIAPVAIQFGASQMVTEGFGETKDAYEHFSGVAQNLEYFNGILEDIGVPLQVVWKNRKEMDVVKDLLKNKPDWLTLVNNCFCPKCYKPSNQRYWREVAPTLKLYDSQCGSCVKCRITNIARILHDPLMQKATEEDIKIYLTKTIDWIRRKKDEASDFIEGSFIRDFKRACKKYNVQIPDDIKAIKDK